MHELTPIYTIDNCRFAAPLQWSLTIFWREPEPDDGWYAQLQSDLEPDGVRLLSHRFINVTTSQLAMSTLPHVAPITIVQRSKGRLSYLVRSRKPKPFKGNFAIRSIGNATRESVQHYVADQLGHHQMADPEVQRRLAQYQIDCSNVDLSQMQKTSHGVYWYNLHLVFVHRERWCEIRHDVMCDLHSMVLAASKKKGFRLASAGILPDHIHLLLGCSFDASPSDIAVGFLNNLAYVHGMKPIYQYGGFIGTVGEYTNKAI